MVLALATMMFAASVSASSDVVNLRLLVPEETTVRYRSVETIWGGDTLQARLTATFEVKLTPAANGPTYAWRVLESTLDSRGSLTPFYEAQSAKGRLNTELRGQLGPTAEVLRQSAEFGGAPFGMQGFGPLMVRLPGREVRVGDRWRATFPMYPGFPDSDQLFQASTESTLVSVDGEWATVEMRGHEVDPKRPSSAGPKYSSRAEVSVKTGIPRRIELSHITPSLRQEATLVRVDGELGG